MKTTEPLFPVAIFLSMSSSSSFASTSMPLYFFPPSRHCSSRASLRSECFVQLCSCQIEGLVATMQLRGTYLRFRTPPPPHLDLIRHLLSTSISIDRRVDETRACPPQPLGSDTTHHFLGPEQWSLEICPKGLTGSEQAPHRLKATKRKRTLERQDWSHFSQNGCEDVH